MTTGSFPLLRAVRLPVALQNLLDLSVAAVMWWSFGWGIAFGVESDSGGFNQFVGPGSFFARGGDFADDAGNYGTTEGYSWSLWLFQVRVYTVHTTSLAYRHPAR